MSCDATETYLERVHEEIEENIGRLMCIYKDLYSYDLVDKFDEDTRAVLMLCNKIFEKENPWFK